MMGMISRDELKQRLDREDGFVLVEALASEQYQKGHLPKAINVPPDQVRELAPNCCPTSGRRSSSTAPAQAVTPPRTSLVS